MVSTYISSPVVTDCTYVKKVIKRAEEYVEKVNYWKRNDRYDYNAVSNSDIFILLLPNNKFKYAIDKLPSGCRRELKEAIAQEKPIFVAYENVSGSINFYHTSINMSMIFAEGGTTHYLHELCENIADATVENYAQTVFEEGLSKPATTINPCNEIPLFEPNRTNIKDFSDFVIGNKGLGVKGFSEPKDRRILLRRKKRR